MLSRIWSKKFKFMPELVQLSYREITMTIATPPRLHGSPEQVSLPVFGYQWRSQEGWPQGTTRHLCNDIYKYVSLHHIINWNRSKLSSQEAWWWAPGLPYDWSQRKPWWVRTTIDEIVWMIKKIMSNPNPNPINFLHQKYPQKWSQIYFTLMRAKRSDYYILLIIIIIAAIQFIPTKTCS